MLSSKRKNGDDKFAEFTITSTGGPIFNWVHRFDTVVKKPTPCIVHQSHWKKFENRSKIIILYCKGIDDTSNVNNRQAVSGLNNTLVSTIHWSRDVWLA